MATKDIRTSNVQVSCDVCGRTLLRGEHAETYLAGGSRRQVCELCTARAVHEGWVREGVALERATRSFGGERRRSLLGRLRRSLGRRDDERPGPAAPRANGNGAVDGWREDEDHHALPPMASPAPRHVHAVPTSVEQRTASAIERFNRSEHPRTVAGVARSLGAPVVVVRPSAEADSLIAIVVSWELCWYRYEVDLSDHAAAVRLVGQGYELDEIPVEDRLEANAAADDYGVLHAA
ncbi:MAG TPA: hypothetical protein VFU94_15140 [Conexibacter sp.]|nr:hypothetical protein [Conexibacter sp.]